MENYHQDHENRNRIEFNAAKNAKKTGEYFPTEGAETPSSEFRFFVPLRLGAFAGESSEFILSRNRLTNSRRRAEYRIIVAA